MKRLVILGGGESGVGTAVLAQKKGYEVFLSDKGKLKDKYKDVLSKYKIDWEEEKHTEELILNILFGILELQDLTGRELTNIFSSTLYLVIIL